MSLKIAVSKGRVYKDFLKLLIKSGYEFDEVKSRKLIISNKNKTLNLIIVKAQDVPLYVDKAFCDLGIVGKDVIDEFNDTFYELLDLDIGKCELCIAAKENFSINNYSYLTIATKYPVQGKKYLKSKNIDGEVIKLNGSVELGPILNISDCILDIVETGNTLRENGLVVKEVFKNINSKLISNKVFYKTKFNIIDDFIKKISVNIGGVK